MLKCVSGVLLASLITTACNTSSGGGSDSGRGTSIASAVYSASLQVAPNYRKVSAGAGGPYIFVVSGGTAPYMGGLSDGSHLISPSQVSTNTDGSVSWQFASIPTSNYTTVLATDSKGQTSSAQLTFALPGSNSANDPSSALQWGLSRIDASDAWPYITDCGVKLIAVIDTGIDANHPDLQGNIIQSLGRNIIASNSNADDDYFHGTHIAGIIGAKGNNGVGITGVCWSARIFAVKALDSQGAGTYSDLIAAMQYAASAGAHIINASWGAETPSSALEDEVNTLESKNILFVAAAGNGRPVVQGGHTVSQGFNLDTAGNNFYPASYINVLDSNQNVIRQRANVISVASVDANDSRSTYSNYGSSTVLIAAPGKNIYSTFPSTPTSAMQSLGQTGDYGTISGTSMATPYVVAAAALLWSYHPTFSVTQVRNEVLSSADAVAGLSVTNQARLNIGRFFP